MILHPGILALICGSGIALLLLLYATGLGLKILRRWDFDSSSEEQLILERKTSLVSTLVSCALGFHIFSIVLFIFTVDEIHTLFVGAMCATGSLNANPVGWSALYAKILVFFAAALWLTLNHLDTRAEDFPLVKRKFAFLLPLTPLLAADLYLQVAYFLGLHPEVITSCCGSLFSQAGSGIAAELSALPAKPVMAAFYGSALLYLGSGLSCLLRDGRFLRYLFSLLTTVFFIVAGAAIVSFISLYIYELPTHHCPFDILQRHYGFVGYPLYFGLFGGTLFGLLPGLLQPLKKTASLAPEIARLEKKWVLLSVFLNLCFLLLATWPILFGHFRLAAYVQ